MNIIINELEVIAPSMPETRPEVARQAQLQATAETQQPPSSLRSEDLERALRRFASRRMRLWAD